MGNLNIVKYNFGTENTHWVYIPENINKNTEIIYAAFNDKRSKNYNNKWKALEEGFLNYGKDKIIVYPENPDLNPGHQNYQIEANQVFNAIKEDYNLETNQFINVGHSAGSGWTLKNLTTYLRENPGVERQTLFLVDSQLDKAMTDEEMNLIAENNTILISYSQPYRKDFEIKKLSRTGLPILYVIDPNIPEGCNHDIWWYHNKVLEDFFKKGLYNSLTDFSQGKGELPDGYVYKIYNPQIGQLEEVTSTEAKEFFKINSGNKGNYLLGDSNLSNMFQGEYILEDVKIDVSNKYSFLNNLKEYNICNLSDPTISSDMKYIQNFANGIVKSIKSDSLFESSTINIAGGVGPLADIINECITLYYDSVAYLLGALSKEADAIVSYGQLWLDTDADLKNVIEDTMKTPVGVTNLFETANNDVLVSNVNDNVAITMSEQIKEENKNTNKNSNVNFNSSNGYSDNKNYTNTNTNVNNTREVSYKKDNYLVVFETKGDEVISMKYQYNYDSYDIALSNYELLLEKLKDNVDIENILLIENKIEIIFKKDVYKNMEISKLLEQNFIGVNL